MSTPASRLFIGNLPYQFTNDELDVILTENGHRAASVHIVKDRETGQGRGFGFAEFGSAAAATAALNQLQGLLVGGRPLRVDYATSITRGPSAPRSSSPPPPRDDWGNSDRQSKKNKGRERGDRRW